MTSLAVFMLALQAENILSVDGSFLFIFILIFVLIFDIFVVVEGN